MVTEVMLNHFDQPWEALKRQDSSLDLAAYGALYTDEIALTLSVTRKDAISALTFTASHDFDPKASQPSAEQCLQNCVDALATVFEHTLGLALPLDALIEGSISEIEGLPLEWSKVEINGKTVYLRADRSNPKLDQAADEWLKKNDPKHDDDDLEAELDATMESESDNDDSDTTIH